MKLFGLNFDEEIKIGEHTYKRPIPKSRNDVLFIDKKADDAYWQRLDDYPDIWFKFVPFSTLTDQDITSYNKDGTLKSLSKDDTEVIIKLYEREFHRRTYGIHFRNKNDIEYLTPSHYFTLQWCKMFGNSKNSGYGFFYKYQRDIFYLLEIMWADWCLGLDISKAKKTGITQIIDGGYCVDLATKNYEWMIGFMSRNEYVSVENNMKLFLYSFDNLPLALKPKVGYKAAKGGNIEFAEVARGKMGNMKLVANDVLNTKVFCVPTSEHSFDSHFMNIIRMDEFPKYWMDSKKEPKEIFRNNKAGAKDQDFFRGRIVISSYPPEEDDKGSEQAAEIYRKSKLSTMKFGKTETELICYHIPAHHSLKSCIDKHGECNVAQAERIIDENRERVKKDKKSLLAEIRQNPKNEIEAFGSENARSPFDPIVLNSLMYDLNELQLSGKTFDWGHLEWVADKSYDSLLWETGKKDRRPKGKFAPVKFVPSFDNTEDKMRMYERMASQIENIVLLNKRDEYDNLLPPKKFRHCGGVDPTDFKDTGNAIEGSMDAMYSLIIHDETINSTNRRAASKIINAEYYARPENPEEFYQDVVKWIIYFGCLVIVEASNGWLAERLEKEGLGHFMLFKDEDGNLTFFRPNHNKTLRHIPNIKKATGSITDDIILLIKNFLTPGDELYNEIDYGKTIKSERLLLQLKKFNPLDTSLYDLVMAFGYTLMCHDNYIALLTSPKDKMYEALYISQMYKAFVEKF